jgi:hypothetical protein
MKREEKITEIVKRLETYIHKNRYHLSVGFYDKLNDDLLKIREHAKELSVQRVMRDAFLKARNIHSDI